MPFPINSDLSMQPVYRINGVYSGAEGYQRRIFTVQMPKGKQYINVQMFRNIRCELLDKGIL